MCLIFAMATSSLHVIHEKLCPGLLRSVFHVNGRGGRKASRP
jgi:hypothetical protein